MERLSTGVRINSAKDDAAGLAIASKMTAQIQGLDQAVRNANDAVSLIQTAEGALVETTNMLQRMRELAVQSASDTNVSADRTALDAEFQQLKAEINRVGLNTQWNGQNILDKSFVGSGTAGTFNFQVGANADQNISLTIGNYRTTGSTNGTVAVATTTGGGASAAQVSTITIAGTWVAGDVISANYGDRSINYTVTAANVTAGTDHADTKTAIAAGLAAAITANKPSTVATAAASGAAVTLTGVANTAQIPVSASVGGLLGGVNSSTITNQATANASITAVSAAIATVNTGRSEMGATMNRLQYAADNLANVSANATESRGRILDTDYAKETTELARTQIISQAGTAMLAQANQMKQTVLSLLK